jgi:Domain of Unknown Function (DUF1080)
MKIFSLVTVVSFVCAAVAAGQDGGKKITFAGAKVGEIPKGWKIEKTGKGTGGDWKIVEDKDAEGGFALAQTKADKKALFNICVNQDTTFKNIDLTVKFKAIAGATDQGGGPVWRFQDGNNYYVARMNPLEDNFRLYKVVAGKRIELASADIEAKTGIWHTIRIVHKGDHIECYLNGKKHLDFKDATFQDAGKVGVWSKADAQTYFANLQITAKRE